MLTTAYLAGIQSHLDMMQAKLASWQAAGYASTNPDMAPMNQGDITTYLTSPAIAPGAGALTMTDIMMQKYLAMGCSSENWIDMRRFNFSAGNVGSFGVVYPGYTGARCLRERPSIQVLHQQTPGIGLAGGLCLPLLK